MTLVLYYVYEQDYRLQGWPDEGGGGMTLYSWYDRDLAGDVLALFYIEPGFFVDGDDVFFQMPPLTTEVTASFFVDEDVFFTPMSVRVLKQPITMLRNEIVRVR